MLFNNYLYLTMIKLQLTIYTNLKYKTKKDNTEGTHLKHYISPSGTQVNSYKYNFLLLILKQHLYRS